MSNTEDIDLDTTDDKAVETDTSSDSENTSEKKHWLYRKENLPKLWVFQIVILVLAVLPEFFIKHEKHLPKTDFTLDTTFGFFAWYGFLTCTAMVICAKLLGFIIKRKDTYYDE